MQQDIFQQLFDSVRKFEKLPRQAVNPAVSPPEENSIDYDRLVIRPGEIFMLLLYVEKHLSYLLAAKDSGFERVYEQLLAFRESGTEPERDFQQRFITAALRQRQLVAENSDKGFLALVRDLDNRLVGILPSDAREQGKSSLEKLVGFRHTIAHSTIYNSLVIEGEELISPHLTKHTSKLKRKASSTHFEDETYYGVKKIMKEAHEFLELCELVIG